MQPNKTNDMNETIKDLSERGQDLLKTINQRHVIIRKADGTQLADVNMATVGIVAFLMLLIQPLGTIVAIAGIAYAIYSKLKISVVQTIQSEDDTFEVNFDERQ